MGREVRHVPANWEHPVDQAGHYIPLCEPQDFLYAYRATLDWNLRHPDEAEEPPNPAHYANYGYKFAGWWQLYENVSEGTPVSPPFATAEELIGYLSSDYRDNLTRRAMTVEQATRLVTGGSAPSMIVAGGVVFAGFEYESEETDNGPEQGR